MTNAYLALCRIIPQLHSPAAEYDSRVAAVIASDDDLAEYVNRLESLLDDEDDDDDVDESAGDDTPTEVTLDPGALVAEVEQFLRDRGDAD